MVRRLRFCPLILSALPLAAGAYHGCPANATAGAVATGCYRDLFVEAGIPEKAVNRKLDAAFRQLFHGDPGSQAVYYAAGRNANGPLAYVTDVANHDVRTEGMSYGMTIAVQMGKKAEFNALWNWSKTYMYHAAADHPSRGFFSWSVKTNGTPNSETPAPDGEEYYTMALYFAAGRWGNGAGIYNYRAEADRLLTDMLHREVIRGRIRQGPYACGNTFDETHKMVRFVPGLDLNNFTDPSYHLPAFYELWSRWGPAADRTFWAEAAAASRDFFQKATNPATGLAPDYANFDGTPHSAKWNRGTADFRYDAWRTAMNWSVDWAWWAKDPRERQLSDRIQAFFAAKGMDTYGNLYTLAGEQLAGSHSTGLIATNAAASLAAANPRAKDFVLALWNSPIPSGPYRYYDGMLYLLSLLHVSGHFRAWSPK
ncbi:MAG TPA: glycosyl hydrolase family 8 [Bryobacteraceae bacterium]|nr:glycosyl hydrolase family 8 [Bryobacteraceae bacterium]